MERELSIEEKIRRAEAISQRRNIGNRDYSAKFDESKTSDFKLFKKMILQVLICLVIYFIFYLIQTTNYVFSASTITKTREILNYDIDIEGIYSNIKSGLDAGTINNQLEATENPNIEETSEVKEENENAQIDVEEDKEEQVKDEILIAQNDEETEEEENEIYLSIPEEINSKYEIIKPATGPISSEFGTREPEGDIVTPYHHGIDIAVVTGTRVESAIDGTVILSATSDSYGKYIKVQNGDLVTLYAHCSELLKTEGEEVGRGEVIALSGATGKVTGPHLHFEIIYKGEYINPRDILEF